MLVRNLKLKWAQIDKINIRDIEDASARRFAGEISSEPRHATVDAYVCSDGRNQGVRQVLKHIPFVNVISVAGNVVYNSNERPTIVIAHGNSEYQNCGAVDHSRDCINGSELKYKAIAETVKSDPIENAKAQLEKVPEKYRAGIIYFNHALCQVEYPEEVNSRYVRKSYSESLYEELFHSLENLYTDDDKARMAQGQNPDFIILSNVHCYLTIFNAFRVDLQRDQFHPIISDSLAYAMDNSLIGEGSFRDTKNAFFIFRKNRKLPQGLDEFLNTAEFIRKYMDKGGFVYMVTVGDLPSDKTIFKIRT
jgi:hypothetical protein